MNRALISVMALLAVPAAAAPRRSADMDRRHSANIRTDGDAARLAQAAAEPARGLSEARVQQAAKLRQTEDALAGVLARLDALTARRAAAAAQKQATAASIATMLPVIARMQRYPVETLLAVPLTPDDAVRGLIVLRGLTAGLERQAARLREEQAEVARRQAELDAALPGLRAAEQAQRAQAADLDAQIAQMQNEQAQIDRTRADDAAAEAARRAAAGAAQADTLRAMLSQMEFDRRTAELRAQTEAAQAARQRREADAAAARQRRDEIARPAGAGVADNQLTMPAAGTLVRGWGAPTDAGPAAGLSYQTPGGARVAAACAGRVVFAGPFRSYGVMAIVDCGAGWHAVLAGLERLDVSVGRAVLAGEPIGVMPGGRPLLYIELRHEGQPVNPAPFLRARPVPS